MRRPWDHTVTVFPGASQEEEGDDTELWNCCELHAARKDDDGGQ